MPSRSSGPATNAPSDERDRDADNTDQRGADADADRSPRRVSRPICSSRMMTPSSAMNMMIGSLAMVSK